MEQLAHDAMQWVAGLVAVWRGVAILQAVIESRVRTEERIEALKERISKLEVK